MVSTFNKRKIPHVDIVVKAGDVENDFTAVILEIRPEWKKSQVKFETLVNDTSGGLINTMVKCYWDKEPNDVIMIRIHNSGPITQVINRKIEIKCIKKLQEKECAPEMLATFQNGFCYKFIHGVILNHHLLNKEPIWRLIAEEFAKIHSTDIEEDEDIKKEPQLFTLVAQLWSVYPLEYKDSNKNERFNSAIPDKKKMREELDFMLDHVKELGSPLVLCHNDPRAENIVWNEQEGILKWIDFEAMHYNFQAFEIAMHFLRFAGFESPDSSAIPDEKMQSKWLEHYLHAFYQYTGKYPNKLTEKDIWKLYVQVNKYMLLGFLFSAIASISMEVVQLFKNDKVDLLSIAIWGINEYFSRKEEIIQLQMPKD